MTTFNAEGTVVRGVPTIPYPSRDIPVYMKAVPATSSIRYVFNVVMSGQKGSIGWDPTGDNMVLYLRVDAEDHKATQLEVGTEIWATFRMKMDQ